MAPLTVVFKATRTQIGSVTVDATMSASHTVEADTTDHPVDSGGDVTDGINIKAPIFKMDGLLSSLVGTGDGAQDRSLDTYNTLAGLIGKPVKVVTQYRTYDPVVMTSLEVRQDKAFGGAVPFSASFKSIRYANTKTVAVIVDPNSKKPKNMGGQGGSDAGKVKNESALHQKFGAGIHRSINSASTSAGLGSVKSL